MLSPMRRWLRSLGPPSRGQGAPGFHGTGDAVFSKRVRLDPWVIGLGWSAISAQATTGKTTPEIGKPMKRTAENSANFHRCFDFDPKGAAGRFKNCDIDQTGQNIPTDLKAMWSWLEQLVVDHLLYFRDTNGLNWLSNVLIPCRRHPWLMVYAFLRLHERRFLCTSFYNFRIYIFRLIHLSIVGEPNSSVGAVTHTNWPVFNSYDSWFRAFRHLHTRRFLCTGHYYPNVNVCGVTC